MRFSNFAAAAAFAGLANAQSQCLSVAQSIPACALGYIASYAYSSLSCGLADFGCQCANFNSIVDGTGASIGNQPGGCVLGDVLPPAQSLCQCATQYSPSAVTLNSIESKCEPSAAAVPACALGFVAEAGYAIGKCDLNNFECLCSNFDAIQGSVANSIITHCGVASVGPVISSANALCSCVSAGAGGSGSGSPSASATPTGTGSGSGSSSSGGSGTGAKPTGSSAPSKTGSSSGSSSGANPTGSPAPTSGGSGSGGSGSSSTGGGAPKQSQPSGGDNSMPLFTNAGAKVTALGGVIGAVAGLVALL